MSKKVIMSLHAQKRSPLAVFLFPDALHNHRLEMAVLCINLMSSKQAADAYLHSAIQPRMDD